MRFEPDIRANKLHLAPAVPDWIGTLRLERIPIMGGHLGVEVTGEVVKVLEVPEDLTIVSDPRRPTIDQLARRVGASREREREVAVGIGPPLDELQPGRGAARARRAARVNFALTSVRISSPVVERAPRDRAPATCTVCARVDRSRISIHSRSVSKHRDVLERVDVEVGVELAVHHVQHVLVELGRDALRVVVRGLEARRRP